MKRLHMHIKVQDLAQSVTFYKTLFDAEPTVIKPDYAKWMLEDPAVNFALSTNNCCERGGISHVGIQTDTKDDLDIITDRLKAAGKSIFEEEATTCCYAVSDKTWVEDPTGVKWETFVSHTPSSTYYGASGAK
ncbi:MAG: ArsI/CadI family heavy metal resistance metalloenzyme [Pseudomonadota bacterium]